MADPTWLTREVPILEAVAAAEAEDDEAGSAWLAERTGLTLREANRGLKALLAAYPPYVSAIDASDLTGPDFMDVQLLERGRRAVGTWPTEAGGLEALLDVLAERIEAESDEETKGRLTRLREAAQSVGRDVGTSVLTAWLKSVAGLP